MDERKDVALSLHESLPAAFLGSHGAHASRFRLFWTAFLTTNPVYELSMRDLHMTTAKRAKVLIMESRFAQTGDFSCQHFYLGSI